MNTKPKFSSEVKSHIQIPSTVEQPSKPQFRSRTKRIKRKTQSRRIIKMVHTMCIAKKNQDGQIKMEYHQKVIKVQNKEVANLTQEGKRLAEKYGKRMLYHYRMQMQQKMLKQQAMAKKLELAQYMWPQMNYFPQVSQNVYQGFPILYRFW